MKHSTYTMIGSAILLTLTSGASFAGASSDANFTRLDADSNGQISTDEAQAMPALEQNFSQVDQNGDGQVSEKEYLVATGSKPESSTQGEGTHHW